MRGIEPRSHDPQPRILPLNYTPIRLFYQHFDTMSHMGRMKRPNWNTYFMQLADVVATRSNCIRRSVGAVLVQDKRIIATGYNGTPHGIANCDEGGCNRCSERESGKLKSGEREETCVCIHAEQNAVIQAALHGVSTLGATLYTTIPPCSQCAKILINAGIKHVLYRKDPHFIEGILLLNSANINSTALLLSKSA